MTESAESVLNAENSIDEESSEDEEAETIPEITAGAIIEKYTIDGYTYEIEEGDTLTLLHSRHPTSSYYAYTWYVTEGEDLVTIEPTQGTCRVYAKGGTGTVTLQGNLDYTVLLGTSAENYSYEYEMYIHISARSADGSKSELKEWQTCSTCSGSGYITLSGKQKTCPTCAGMGQILR